VLARIGPSLKVAASIEPEVNHERKHQDQDKDERKGKRETV
jgi:hypothetical protein